MFKLITNVKLKDHPFFPRLYDIRIFKNVEKKCIRFLVKSIQIEPFYWPLSYR